MAAARFPFVPVAPKEAGMKKKISEINRLVHEYENQEQMSMEELLRKIKQLIDKKEKDK